MILVVCMASNNFNTSSETICAGYIMAGAARIGRDVSRPYQDIMVQSIRVGTRYFASYKPGDLPPLRAEGTSLQLVIAA